MKTYNLKVTITFTVAANAGTTVFTKTDYAFTIAIYDPCTRAVMETITFTDATLTTPGGI